MHIPLTTAKLGTPKDIVTEPTSVKSSYRSHCSVGQGINWYVARSVLAAIPYDNVFAHVVLLRVVIFFVFKANVLLGLYIRDRA